MTTAVNIHEAKTRLSRLLEQVTAGRRCCFLRLPGQGLELLRVTAEYAEAIRDFPELMRHDPFGRLIVGQASRAGLKLLTADHVLLELRRDFILDASR